MFDFTNATASKGAGGETIGATVANFPVLANQGLAMTVGWLGETFIIGAPLLTKPDR